MSIAPPAAAPAPGICDALAPLLLPLVLRLTAEQFVLVCDANPEAVLELAADGQLIMKTPTGGETGARNTLLCTRPWSTGRRSALSSAAASRPSAPTW